MSWLIKLKERYRLRINKILSYGGKKVLISSVLQSILVYMLFSIIQCISIIKEIHRIFENFFVAIRYYREANNCLLQFVPKEKEGLGFRSLMFQRLCLISRGGD